MLLLADTSRNARAAIAVVSSLAQLAAAVVLLALAAGAWGYWPNEIGVYLPGDWPAPFGIERVVDRLAAIMLAPNAVLGLMALNYLRAGGDRRVVELPPLVQFLQVGQ